MKKMSPLEASVFFKLISNKELIDVEKIQAASSKPRVTLAELNQVKLEISSTKEKPSNLHDVEKFDDSRRTQKPLNYLNISPNTKLPVTPQLSHGFYFTQGNNFRQDSQFKQGVLLDPERSDRKKQAGVTIVSLGMGFPTKKAIMVNDRMENIGNDRLSIARKSLFQKLKKTNSPSKADETVPKNQTDWKIIESREDVTMQPKFSLSSNLKLVQRNEEPKKERPPRFKSLDAQQPRENKPDFLIKKGHRGLLVVGSGKSNPPLKKKDGHLHASGLICGSIQRSLEEDEINSNSFYHFFIRSINAANGIPIMPIESSTTNFKALIGKGNNESIVAEILRRRPWWNISFSASSNPNQENNFNWADFNLVWSQGLTRRFSSLILSGKRCFYKEESCHYSLNEFLGRSKRLHPATYEKVKEVLNSKTGKEFIHIVKKISSKETLEHCIRVYLKIPIYHHTPLRIPDINQLIHKQTDLKAVAEGDYLTEAQSAKEERRQSTNQKKDVYTGIANSSWQRLMIHNHVEGFEQLCDKMYLFTNLRILQQNQPKAFGDVLSIMPYTVLVQGVVDQQLIEFQQTFAQIDAFNSYSSSDKSLQSLKSIKEAHPTLGLGTDEIPIHPFEKLKTIFSRKNMWIVKPGENSNRGKKIAVASSIQEVLAQVKSIDGPAIIQKYIENPLLYEGRKFDIRMYALITWVNGSVKLYFYEDGYCRTSSFEFKLETTDRSVHLTNEAVQIKSEEFGKFEKGNKLTLEELSQYIKSKQASINFFKEYIPKMKVT